MTAILANSDLSAGDLRLTLRNAEGYLQDAFKVTWTVLSSTNVPVSGTDLPALKCGTGVYYAPWCARAINGNYRISWKIQEDSNSIAITREDKFFVVEPSAYQCLPNFVCDNGQPEPGGFAYLTGALLGRGDLPLFLKNSDGLPVNAYSVLWTILNAAGVPVTNKMEAENPAVGEYYASWFINVLGGDYIIRWEWLAESGHPVESKDLRFSVISPPSLVFTSRGSCLNTSSLCSGISSECVPCVTPIFQTQVINKQVVKGGSISCGPYVNAIYCVPASSSPSTSNIAVSQATISCNTFEISRVVHLAGTALPAGGAFTNQSAYNIPPGVRKIAFYISYTRGSDGGYGLFRLLWGNGTEETQSTLIDSDYTSLSSVSSSQDMFLNDLKGPVPPNNDAIHFTLETAVPGGATTVRLLASEGGVVGAPGTVSISLTASS